MLFLPGLLSSSSSFESSCCEYLKIEPPHTQKKKMPKDTKSENFKEKRGRLPAKQTQADDKKRCTEKIKEKKERRMGKKRPPSSEEEDEEEEEEDEEELNLEAFEESEEEEYDSDVRIS